MKSLVARIGQLVRRSAEKEDEDFEARLRTLAGPKAPRRGHPVQPAPTLFRRHAAIA
ncbi:MAG: hypothetical protein JSR87_14250 [Proteobacteria bacterium]|nr:hypothetical protein [Pseudomonadota bacterium]MBS0574771.1 hypothetical protein [Pseudomonadota bacterium]